MYMLLGSIVCSHTKAVSEGAWIGMQYAIMNS